MPHELFVFPQGTVSACDWRHANSLWISPPGYMATGHHARWAHLPGHDEISVRRTVRSDEPGAASCRVDSIQRGGRILPSQDEAVRTACRHRARIAGRTRNVPRACGSAQIPGARRLCAAWSDADVGRQFTEWPASVAGRQDRARESWPER